MAAQDYYHPSTSSAPPYPPSTPGGPVGSNAPNNRFSYAGGGGMSATSPPPYEPFPPQYQPMQQAHPPDAHPSHFQSPGLPQSYVEKPSAGQHGSQAPMPYSPQGLPYGTPPAPPQHVTQQNQHLPQFGPHPQPQPYNQPQYTGSPRPQHQQSYQSSSPRMSGAVYPPQDGSPYAVQWDGHPTPSPRPQHHQALPSQGYGPSFVPGRPHSQPPPNAIPAARLSSEGRPHRPQSPRRRRSDSRDRDIHRRHHDRTRSSAKKGESGIGTFIGAGGGALVGDAIFPGLGTLGGALLGGYGGHHIAKERERRGSESRVMRRRDRYDDDHAERRGRG